MTKRPVLTSDDLKPGHWMARQLPTGTSLRGYAEERAISLLTRAVQRAVDDAGLSRSDLASLLGTTKSYVSQVLNGSANMTLRTLGALLWATGNQIAELEVEETGTLTKRDNTLTLSLPYTFSPSLGSGTGAAIRQVGDG